MSDQSPRKSPAEFVRFQWEWPVDYPDFPSRAGSDARYEARQFATLAGVAFAPAGPQAEHLKPIARKGQRHLRRASRSNDPIALVETWKSIDCLSK